MAHAPRRALYTLAVKRDFIAQHLLSGGDWGRENEMHSHQYRVEIRLEGNELNANGFVVDRMLIEERLEETIALYRDMTLNRMPEFGELNPSIENFARIFCYAFLDGLDVSNLTSITVRMWENDEIWTSFRREFG